ncbi:MAG: hypothetical protein AABX51_07965 [Nanoarchaeota archaeon]
MWPFKKAKSLYSLPKLPPLPQAMVTPQIPLTDDIDLPEPPLPGNFLPSTNPMPVPEVVEPKKESLELPETILPEMKPVEPEPILPLPLDSITLWLSNGVVVKTLEELSEAVSAMSEATFHYHVNTERNDLANWIQDVLGERDIAMKLAPVHKRTDFLNILQAHLSSPKIIKSKKSYDPTVGSQRFAYLGLRGMATSLDPASEFIGFRASAKSSLLKPKKELVPEKKVSSIEPARKALEQFESMRIKAETIAAKPEKKTYTGGEIYSKQAIAQLDSMKNKTESTLAKPERKTFSGGGIYSKQAIEQLDSMRDAEVMLTRIQPKGTMLAEILRKKHEERMKARSIILAQDHSIATIPQSPLAIPKLVLNPTKKVRAQRDAQQQVILIHTLEEAKQKAEESDVPSAKKLLEDARNIIKIHFNGKKKPFQYYIWDAENSLRRAQLS